MSLTAVTFAGDMVGREGGFKWCFVFQVDRRKLCEENLISFLYVISAHCRPRDAVEAMCHHSCVHALFNVIISTVDRYSTVSVFKWPNDVLATLLKVSADSG